MAFNPAPSNWIPGYTVSSGNIVIPIASLPALTTAKANATTGDIRDVVYAMNDQIFLKFRDTVVADRPTKMLIRQSSFASSEADQVTRTYSSEFILQGEFTIAPET
jgi:hypothetical protein